MADKRYDTETTPRYTPEGDLRGVDVEVTTTTPGYGGETRARSAGTQGSAPARDSARWVSRGRSIPDLLREFSRELGTLVRQEMALAKAEMREKVAMLGRNAMIVAIGGVLALAGLIVLMGALVAGLSAIMAAAGVEPGVYSWLSPLIVSVVVLGIAGAMIAKGINKIKSANMAPERTAQSLRETGEWVKEKVS